MRAFENIPGLKLVPLLAITMCWSVMLQAQTNDDVEFSLFEDVEANRAEQQRARPNRQSNERGGRSSQPEFTLVGTSRIGDSYSAILLHRGGDSVYISDIDPQANTRITGYRNYTIVHVGRGSVSIRNPDSDPCVEAKDKGVSCSNAGNIMMLSLANGEPLAGRAPAIATTESDEAADGEVVDEDVPINPFEALRAARENGSAPEAGQASPGNNRFTPRRIAPEDVPPGYRVVSTPFGDRLVEQ